MDLLKLFYFMNFSSCLFKKRRTRVWALVAGIKMFGSKKKDFILGAATYGAQAGIHLGCRNLRRPRRAWSWGKIQNFIDALSEIGNAKLNVFCAVF